MLKKLYCHIKNTLSYLSFLVIFLLILKISSGWCTNQDFISELHPPILEKIFSYLDVEDLGNMAQVSKQLKKISERNVCWDNKIVSLKTKEDFKNSTYPFIIEEQECGDEHFPLLRIKLSYVGKKNFNEIRGIFNKGGRHECHNKTSSSKENILDIYTYNNDSPRITVTMYLGGSLSPVYEYEDDYVKYREITYFNYILPEGGAQEIIYKYIPQKKIPRHWASPRE